MSDFDAYLICTKKIYEQLILLPVFANAFQGEYITLFCSEKITEKPLSSLIHAIYHLRSSTAPSYLIIVRREP